MYCRYCGKQIADDSKYCNYCGKCLDHVEMQKIEKVE